MTTRVLTFFFAGIRNVIDVIRNNQGKFSLNKCPL